MDKIRIDNFSFHMLTEQESLRNINLGIEANAITVFLARLAGENPPCCG